MARKPDLEELEAEEKRLGEIRKANFDAANDARRRMNEAWYELDVANKAIKSTKKLKDLSWSSYQRAAKENPPKIKSFDEDLARLLDKVEIENANELEASRAGRIFEPDEYIRQLNESVDELSDSIINLVLEIGDSRRRYKFRASAHTQALQDKRNALSVYIAAKKKYEEAEAWKIKFHGTYQSARAAYEEELYKLKARAGIQNQNVGR